MILRVAVIGAGAAGLAALRHLVANPQKFAPVAYEMTPHVSGTWVYTDRVGTDEQGLPLHSSMYKNLRTNLPKEVMAFPDFAFSRDLPSFVKHTDVRQYLEDYAKHFNLRDHIQFNTRVDSVRASVTEEGRQVWEIMTTNICDSHTPSTRHVFDAVIVCNGHYAVPLMPELPGLEQFQGRVIHSHDYRRPDVYRDQTVAILGGAASGQDMAIDIATVAKHVYLLHNKPALCTILPDNMSQGVGIREMLPDGVLLTDGTHITIDTLLLCTGYRYDFSFLRPECRPNVTDERVTPLYKHIIHTRYPSLSFIGICKKICPFPQFDCQVRFVLASLTGQMVLPSREEMDEDTDHDFRWRTVDQSMPARYAHLMGTLQWGYNNELAELAGFAPIPKVVETLYDTVHRVRVKNLPGYKNVNYKLISDSEYREISS